MDEARNVLDRLARIEALQQADAPPRALLEELRGLLADAEAWIDAEGAGTDLAAEALARCRRAYDAGSLPLGA